MKIETRQTEMMRPIGSFVHIPDNWKLSGYDKSMQNRFEFEPVYSDGNLRLTESEMLKQGVACYRMQIDKYSVRDFYIKSI